jgi:hypothetical protein
MRSAGRLVCSWARLSLSGVSKFAGGQSAYWLHRDGFFLRPLFRFPAHSPEAVVLLGWKQEAIECQSKLSWSDGQSPLSRSARN